MADTHVDVLRRHGLRATGPRRAIVQALHELGGTADVAEIHQCLGAETGIHKTTLYRNLETLEQIGIVRRVFDGERALRYELACEHGQAVHPHFHCRKCGALYCLDAVDLSAASESLISDPGFRAEGVEVRFVGLCKKCR